MSNLSNANNKTLIVPFQTRFLYCPIATTVTEANADFSQLPYYNGSIIQNANHPYLSENIVSPPFQNQRSRLAAGSYLHFILPKALTTTIKNGQQEQIYPPVPNRWLVVKKTEHKVSKWIIESDYLWADDADSLQTQGKVSVPLPMNWLKQQDHFPKPYRYMGRCYEFSEWQTSGEQGEYWSDIFGAPLTAMGYGNETFAGFFPNSRDVFSFFDDDANATSATYEVYGWYKSSNEKTTESLLLKGIQNEYPNSTEQLEMFLNAMNWKLEDASKQVQQAKQEEELPQRILLYSSIQVALRQGAENATTSTSTKVAIGQQGTEALSAYLAREIAPDNAATIEDQLEAMQFDFLEQQQLDMPQRFQMARHQKGFVPTGGGTVWTIQLASSDEEKLTTSAYAQEVSRLLTDQDIDNYLYDASLLVAKLNYWQYEYDTRQFKIPSKRHQLFADWYKYMLAAHPPVGQEGDYPRADDILQFINSFVISDIYNSIQVTGSITITKTGKTFEDNYAFVAANISQKTSQEQSQEQSQKNIAHQLAAAAQALIKHLAQLRTIIQQKLNTRTNGNKDEYVYPLLRTLQLGYALSPQPAPRFYRPTEPVVLLAGDLMRPATLPLNEVACMMLEIDWQHLLQNIPAPKLQEILETQYSPRKAERSDWHPTLLEWEVTYTPVDDPSDAPLGYQLDFVKNNFELRPQTTDLQLIEGTKEAAKFSDKVRYYRGSTILTDYTNAFIQQKIKTFLEKRKHLDMSGHPAHQALTTLEQTAVLTQSLGGLLEALLMRKQTLQLEVADPIALPNYAPLIESIRNFIGDAVKSAPEVSNYFNPIFSGGFNLVRLRVIDSFGRMEEVFNQDAGDVPLVSRPLLPPPNLKPSFHGLFSPRLVQEARLNLDWVAAEDKNVISTTHTATTPVCGWIVPNFLEEMLSLFDHNGALLGNIGYVDDEIDLIPRAGRNVFRVTEVKNVHLYRFVAYMVYQGADFFDDFLAELRVSLEHIDPENAQAATSLMTGRPLALARLRLNLELKADAALNQDWQVFRRDVVNANSVDYQRATYDFEAVRFPIMLGDASQYNDGLVGFWEDGTQDGIDTEDNFYVPNLNYAAGSRQSPYIKTASDADYLLHQSIANQPYYLTMLFDPRGQLNVTTGILPRQTIELAPTFWKKAMDELRVEFLVAPFLTPRGKFQLPLPNGQSNWQFTFLDENKLRIVPQRPKIDRITLENAWTDAIVRNTITTAPVNVSIWETLMDKNWLQPVQDDPSSAYINYDRASREALPEAFAATSDIIEQLFNTLQISLAATVTDPQFGQMELREGWLRC